MRHVLLVMALVCCGCSAEELPGEVVGEFEAEGFLTEQSCGDAVGASDPIDLDFTLSVDEDQTGRAYIEVEGGVFTGTVIDDEYVFRVTQTWTVIEPSSLETGCYVTQEDVLSIVLDSGEDGGLRTASGLQTSEYEPITGSDCVSALSASGGLFLTLPCRVEYVVTGDEI